MFLTHKKIAVIFEFARYFWEWFEDILNIQ